MRTTIHHQSAARPDVSINGIVVAHAAIAREAQHHAGGSPQQAWQDATRALVVRELLLQRARSRDLAIEPSSEDGLRETDDEALIRALLEAEVRTPRADDTACRRYYDANPWRFRSPDIFEPQHILFQAARDNDAAYAKAIARAEAVLAEVTVSPDRFETLARAVSCCPSAGDGGRLGQVARGDTTPEFEAAMLGLEPGQICPELVQTRYGVHVLRLDRRAEGRTLPFEQVRERISDYLEERSWRCAVAQYVSLLAGEASISGFDMPYAEGPLVQ